MVGVDDNDLEEKQNLLKYSHLLSMLISKTRTVFIESHKKK